MDILQAVAQTLVQVREKRPLVHHVTNYVTAADCANIALAAGASPVMAGEMAEVEEMAAIASALVINIGTLTVQSVEAMIAAGKRAVELGIPVVFDPVGAGATRFRMRAAERIIREVRPSVIRGNMSEIKILAGLDVSIRGVDAAADESDSAAVARDLAQRLDCVVAITGKRDVVAQGNNICRIDNGHVFLSAVTGTGCMATTLAGCCCGALKDPFVGTVAGIVFMGIAGEMAQQSLKPGEGIGTFRVRLFDAIWNMTPEIVLNYGKVRGQAEDQSVRGKCFR